MNTLWRIAKNTATLSFTELATNFINFLFYMFVARYLGAEGFGILSFAFAFTAVFNVLTDIGLSRLMIREVARNKSQTSKYMGNVVVIKTVLCFATFGLMALVINILGYPQQTINVVYLVGLSVVANAFNSMFYSIFQSYERMEFIAVVEIPRAALVLTGSLLSISQGLDVNAIATIYFLAGVLALGFNATLSAWQIPKPKVEIDLVFWKEVLAQAWPFGLTMAFAGVIYWISSVMLSIMHGNEAVGWYNAAYRPAIALLFISTAYGRSIFPAMAKYHISSRDSLRLIFEKSIILMVTLAIPLGIGVTLLADEAILLLFGSEYYQSIVALRIIIWSVMFVLVSTIFAELLNSINRQKIVTLVTAGSVFLSVLLNIALIPKYNYVGASIAAVVTEFFALVLIFICSRKTGYSISVKRLTATVSRVLTASIVMGVFVFFSHDILALWLLIPLAALLYFVVLYVIRGIDRKDLVIIKQALAVTKTSSYTVKNEQGKEITENLGVVKKISAIPFVENIIYEVMYKRGILKRMVRQNQVRLLLNSLNSATGGYILRELTLDLAPAQKERIKDYVDPSKRTVALCFPPLTYGENLGNIAEKLRIKGYNALVLRGLAVGETNEEQQENVFGVPGSVWANVADVVDIDLYVFLGASEYFPKNGKIVMFVHDIHDSAAGRIDHVLKTQSTFDYFFLPSRCVIERIKQQVTTGKERFHKNSTSSGKQICLIGGGYPKLDSNLRYFKKNRYDSKTIILATTVMDDFEGLVCLPSYADNIIEAVLSTFTDYDVVFRPHPHTLKSNAVQKIAEKYKNRPKFTLDCNPNFYMDNYSKSALMITDMSGTAYTYAFTTLRPVVFFSPNEPAVKKRFGTYQYFLDRYKVGYIAENPNEMIEKIRLLLATRDQFSAKIKEYRDSSIFNIGYSEDYFVDNIEYIIEDKKHPDWIYI